MERTRRDEESRKELLAGISHDLRSPLTSIRAYVEGLLDGVARTEEARRRYPRISLEESGRMTLADDGPGVPEEALPRLFDAFYRSDPARRDPAGGSGLGLAIAAKAVHAMGGTIRARSGPGGGLAIEITLQKEESCHAEDPDHRG